MRILGVDFGQKKTGLALATAALAEPLMVIKHQYQEELTKKLKRIIQEKRIEQIVLGLPEGKQAEEIKKFGKQLEKEIEIPIVFQDETLTTQDAQKLALQAGIKRQKRKRLEDAFAATVILQDYLNRQES